MVKRYIKKTTAAKTPAKQTVEPRNPETSIKGSSEELLDQKIARLEAYVEILHMKLVAAATQSDKTKLEGIVTKACDTLKEVVRATI